MPSPCALKYPHTSLKSPPARKNKSFPIPSPPLLFNECKKIVQVTRSTKRHVEKIGLFVEIFFFGRALFCSFEKEEAWLSGCGREGEGEGWGFGRELGG